MRRRSNSKRYSVLIVSLEAKQLPFRLTRNGVRWLAMLPRESVTFGRFILTSIFLCLSIGVVAQSVPPQLATPKQIRDMLVQRIDVDHKSTGIVVGVISKRGREIIGYGRFDRDDPRVPDGQTVFEIGSVTKIFTALLLSDMALHGEVALNDPVAKYLPPSVHAPMRNGKQITLLDLATHYSGLPPEPAHSNQSYSVHDLYDFLNHYELTRDPGAKFEYSNYGFGLLGQLLAQRAGTDYETLLRTRITGPLQMNHTGVHLTADMQAHLTPGHSGQARSLPIPVHALAPTGAIRSNVEDMLIFLAANLGLIETSLEPAMKQMLKVHRHEAPGLDIGIGWDILQGPNQAAFHNGKTYGYHAFIVVEPRRRIGVVVLSNTSEEIGDIAWQILDHAVAAPTVWNVGPQPPR